MSPHPPLPKEKKEEKTFEQSMADLANRIFKNSTNKPSKIHGFLKGVEIVVQASDKQILELTKINDQLLAENKKLEKELTALKSQNK